MYIFQLVINVWLECVLYGIVQYSIVFKTFLHDKVDFMLTLELYKYSSINLFYPFQNKGPNTPSF